DTRIYLREFTAENTSLDSVPGASFRPICDYVVPPGLPLEGKRKLIERFNSAINRAMDLREDFVALPIGKRVTTCVWLQSIRECPVGLAAFGTLMAFETPMVMEFVPKH